MGHRAQPQAGEYDWRRLIADIVEQERTHLRGLAVHLAAETGEDAETVRKGLQRLQRSKTGQPGKYGKLLLRRFPIVGGAEHIGRYLGQYHGPAADLAADVRRNLLDLHDRPPFSGTAAIGWLHVGRAGLAIWREDWQEARGHLARVVPGKASQVLKLEFWSVLAFVESRTTRPAAQPRLDEMRRVLDAGGLCDDDAACYHARWADQAAYELYKPWNEASPDLPAARALFESIADDGPPFARVRRHLGLSVVSLAEGNFVDAEARATLAADIAGDNGLVRLRAQALRQIGRCLARGGALESARTFNSRAAAIAARLGDKNLETRVTRGQRR